MRELLLHPSTKYYFFHPFELIQFYLNILWLKIKILTKKDINFLEHQKSDLPIDIVMPTLDRDYEVVTKVIDSIRENIKHPIGRIIIISPKSAKIEELCRRKSCFWVNENSVLPIKISDLDIHIQGINRSGWIYQQLLKWASVKYLKSEFFLITESDTIYSRPQVFEHKGKTIFASSSALCHLPYFYSYRQLFGKKIKATHNLTSHHLLFREKYIGEAKKKIEQIHKKSWYQAIIDTIDHKELSSISDYELYGQYVLQHYPHTVELEHWANVSFSRNSLKNLTSLLKKYYKTAKTLSFHSYDE